MSNEEMVKKRWKKQRKLRRQKPKTEGKGQEPGRGNSREEAVGKETNSEDAEEPKKKKLFEKKNKKIKG